MYRTCGNVGVPNILSHVCRSFVVSSGSYGGMNVGKALRSLFRRVSGGLAPCRTSYTNEHMRDEYTTNLICEIYIQQVLGLYSLYSGL